ncbi:MAG: DUF2069 domain-containing protein [Pseudomonadota bacterium]
MTALSAAQRSPRSATMYRLSLGSLAVLLAAQALDSWQRDAPAVIWILRLVPLLIFLPGLLRDHTRSFVWLCFVSLLVFVTLVERLFADVRDPVAWTAMLAVVTYFNAGMMYVRWRSQELNPERASEANAEANVAEVNAAAKEADHGK